MPWNHEVDIIGTTVKLKQFYKEIEEKRGKISNIMKIHSLNQEAMKNHMDLYLTLMFRSSGLSREEREFIAVTVIHQYSNLDLQAIPILEQTLHQ